MAKKANKKESKKTKKQLYRKQKKEEKKEREKRKKAEEKRRRETNKEREEEEAEEPIDVVLPSEDELIIERAEARLRISWDDLLSAKYGLSHNKQRGTGFMPVMLELFYDEQGNTDWDYIEKGSIRKYYEEHGLDTEDWQGTTLRYFIQYVMGIPAGYTEEVNPV